MIDLPSLLKYLKGLLPETPQPDITNSPELKARERSPSDTFRDLINEYFPTSEYARQLNKPEGILGGDPGGPPPNLSALIHLTAPKYVPRATVREFIKENRTAPVNIYSELLDRVPNEAYGLAQPIFKDVPRNVARKIVREGPQVELERGWGSINGPQFFTDPQGASRLSNEEVIEMFKKRAPIGKNSTEPVFRSRIAEAVADPKFPNKFSGDQVLNAIKNTTGVKQEELDWLDLEPFLKGRKGVTKAELIAEIDRQSPDLIEKELGTKKLSFAEWRKNIFDKASDKGWVDHDYPVNHFTDDELVQMYENGGKLPYERWKVKKQADYGNTWDDEQYRHLYQMEGPRPEYTTVDLSNPPVYGDPNLQLPGGKNYREFIVKLENPQMKPDPNYIPGVRVRAFGDPGHEYEQIIQADKVDMWRKSAEKAGWKTEILDNTKPKMVTQNQPPRHFHDKGPNQLFHVRTTDRTLPDGRKILFLEEVQSDWHQAKRQVETDKKWIERLKAERPDIPITNSVRDVVTPPISDWSDLAMKRMVRKAADEGYDGIAWTTGQQQQERYNKILEGLTEVKYDPHTLELRGFNSAGDEILDRYVSPRDLPSEVGKENAERLMFRPDKPGASLEQLAKFKQTLGQLENEQFELEAQLTKLARDPNSRQVDIQDIGRMVVENGRLQKRVRENMHRSSGASIYTPRIGGTGMETHYDTVLPKAANKIGKKFGTAVQRIELNNGTPVETGYINYKFPPSVHFLPFTPALKESVKKTSFPLWQIGAGALGLESIYEQTNPNNRPPQ